MKKITGHAKNHGESLKHVSGFGGRMATASTRVGTRKMAASAAGVSVDSLQRYLREERFPPIDVVAALAAAANVCVRWLITGEGSAEDQPSGSLGQLRTEQFPQPLPILSGYSAISTFLDDVCGKSAAGENSVGAHGSVCYEMHADSSAMAPNIPKGSRLLVSTNSSLQPATEFLAVVLLPEWGEVVVRRWVRDMGSIRLEPIASGYRSLEITNLPHRLAGVVVEIVTTIGA